MRLIPTTDETGVFDVDVFPVGLTQGAVVALGNTSGALVLSTQPVTVGHVVLTATGNLTLNPAGLPIIAAGRTWFTYLEITQDGTGSRTLTLDAAIKTAYGVDPVLSTAANARDILYVRGRNDGAGILWTCGVSEQALA